MSSCVDTLGPGYLLCNSNHCNQFQETSIFHATCECIDWQGNPIPDCNPKNSNYPVQTGECYNRSTGEIQNTTSDTCSDWGKPWIWRTCYCCCTCFAANTPIGVPSGTIAIGDIIVGNSVLAASGSAGNWSWSAQSVTFSSGSPAATGTNPTAGNIMILMIFGDNQALILSRDQLMLMSDGKLKRADQLVPGTDELVAVEGGHLAIHMMSTGYYKGAVHHIATDTPSYDAWDGSIDNHLIGTNSVIGGDYLLQMYQDTPKMKPNLSSSEAPKLGTAEYTAGLSGVRVKPFVVGTELVPAGIEATVHGFRAHAESAASIPGGAFQLFTGRQEALLLGPSIPKRGFSDVTNVQLTNYYTKIFGAFFPLVDIYLDWESIHPNVYAFEQYGRHTVVIGGELLRLGPLYDAAIAMALSFGVASATIDSNNVSVGHSIYDGVGVIMPQVFQGGSTLNTLQQRGQSQFDALLELLAGEEGTEKDGGLGATCMASTINAAISGDPLPECAGGPPAAKLAVLGADYVEGRLTIRFSMPIDPASAVEVKNYALTPSGTLTGLEIPVGVSSMVSASVVLDPGSYSLTVSRVTGADGGPLDPAHSSTGFEVGPDPV